MASNQKQHFVSEAARYRMLAREALFAVVTAMPQEYYDQKAREFERRAAAST